MQRNIGVDQQRIEDFCRRWRISEFSLFGSVLRDDFWPDSDIDVLVAFAPEASATLFDLVTMKEELELIFGRRVDLVTRAGVESSGNWIRRAAILDTVERVI